MVILKALLTPSSHFNILSPFASIKAAWLLAAIEVKNNRAYVLDVLRHNRAEYQKGVLLAVLASALSLGIGLGLFPGLLSEFAGVSSVMLFYGLILQSKVNWFSYQQRLLLSIRKDIALEKAGPRSSVKYFIRRGFEEDGLLLKAEFDAAMLLYKQGRIWEPGKVKISRKGLIA